jgi:hypothetical protein
MSNIENDQSQLSIVKPSIRTQDAMADLRSFEELKSKLLTEKDYQVISGKNFIKKSGWRKLALVFNISDQIVESTRTVRENGSFVWNLRVRATAPNGRFTEAVGACDSLERKFAHPEHDVYATGHTRSKSRAISDLIGAGEISAEEMDYDAEPLDLTAEPTDEEKEQVKSMFQPASEMYKQSEPVPVVEQNGNARRLELMYNGKAFPILESEPPFSRFFLQKICKNVVNSNPGARYELARDDKGRITAIVWSGLQNDQQFKELESTLAWSVKKVAEKRKGTLKEY